MNKKIFFTTAILLLIILLSFIPQLRDTDSYKNPRALTIYTFVHFFAGFIVGTYTNITFIQWTFIHLGWELFENTLGLRMFQKGGIIQKTFKNTPFGWNDYVHGDSTINSILDTIFALIGYLFAVKLYL